MTTTTTKTPTEARFEAFQRGRRFHSDLNQLECFQPAEARTGLEDPVPGFTYDGERVYLYIRPDGRFATELYGRELICSSLEALESILLRALDNERNAGLSAIGSKT